MGRWLVVLAVAVGSAACSSATSTTTPSDDGDLSTEIGAAFTRLDQAGTYRTVATLDVGSGDVTLSVVSDAAVDRERGLQAVSVEGEAVGTTEIVLDGSTAYVRGSIAAGLGAGERWVRIELDDPPPGFENLATEIADSLPENDLRISDLVAGVTEARLVEENDGVRHLAADLDFALALEGATEQVRERMALEIGQLDAFDELSVVLEVWIDRNGYPVRSMLTMQGEAPDGSDLALTTDASVSAIGEPVAIDIPSGRNVVDATDIAS